MTDALELTSSMKKFVLQWGEMGTLWGINRSVAQIHALLYLSDRPLDAATISETLGIARSNTSTSLRELLNYGVVRTAPSLADRRDLYEALVDPWEVALTIVRARKSREIDPTLRIMREISDELDDPKTPADKHARDRVRALLVAFETGSAAMDEVLKLSPATLRNTASLSGKIKALFKTR